MPRTSLPIPRFMAKVNKQTDGCWLWTASTTPNGYGRFSRRPQTVETAHRASYFMFVGDVPDGQLVCHKCDVRLCVNPAHLFLGTPAENMRDMANKWRTRSKLTHDEVEAIRRSGDEYRIIAARFGLKSHKSVYNIKRGLTFRVAA